MSIQFTKKEFDNAYGRLRANANQNNLDFNALILGGAQLYFEHKFNTGYIERAMLIARNHSGLRVNAVRSFLQAMTGVKIPARATGKPMKKGKLEEAPQALIDCDDWVEWADTETPEPMYDHKAVTLKLQKYLEKQQENAKEHDDSELSEQVAQMLEVMAPKKVQA